MKPDLSGRYGKLRHALVSSVAMAATNHDQRLLCNHNPSPDLQSGRTRPSKHAL